MPKRQVFYSFHYGNDVMRVQQIRNMGIIEGNSPVSPNSWETVKKNGDAAIEKWINENMQNRSCVIVLIGSNTANRKWINYEIKNAWENNKGLFGIYIHNLKDPIFGRCTQGKNPFDFLQFSDGTSLSSVIKCYNPNPTDAYNDIKNNITIWIENAIAQRT